MRQRWNRDFCYANMQTRSAGAGASVAKLTALVSRGLLLNQPEIQDLVFSQPIRFNASAGNPLDSLENADLEITVLTTTKPWL